MPTATDRAETLEEYAQREALAAILLTLTDNYLGHSLLDERTQRDLFGDLLVHTETIGELSARQHERLWPSDEWPDGPAGEDYDRATARAELIAARVLGEIAAEPQTAARAAAALTENALRIL